MKLLLVTLLLFAAGLYAQDTGTAPESADPGAASVNEPPAAPAPEPAAPAPEPAAPAPEPAAPASDAPAAPAPEAGTPAEPAAPAGDQPETVAGEPSGDKPEAEGGDKGGKDKVQWTVGMGSVTVDGKQWNRLSLRPDIPLGKFGICLDIEIFIDDSGNISKKGWNFDDAKNAFESIQRKIYYLRYGHPGDKFYAKVGSLDEVTLGYGLMMSGYSNALQYPDIKKTGLHLELNEVGSLGIGLQTMVNNFQDFQKGGALIGARLSVKPISFLGIPILKNLSVGGSYINDMNQQSVIRDRDKDSVPDALDMQPDDKNWAVETADYSRYPTLKDALMAIDRDSNRAWVNRYKPYIGDKDPFAMVGADIGLPIINRKFLGLLFYGQLAMNMDKTGAFDTIDTKGWGIAAPGAQFRVGPVTLNAEYRHFKDRFQGEYFDQTYELDRVMQRGTELLTKEQQLEGLDSTTRSGIFSRARLNLLNVVTAQASYQWMTVTDNHKVAQDDVPEADQSFSASAGLGETVKNILRKVKIDDINAYYFKKNIGTWQVDTSDLGEAVYDKFLEPTPYVLLGYKIGFQLSQSLVLYWDNQYTFTLDESTPDDVFDLKRVKRLNIETVMKF